MEMTTIEAAGPPMPAVTRILSNYNRSQVEAFIEIAVAMLDVVDGDPDLEAADPAGETVPVIDDPDVPPDEDDGDPDLEETDCEDSFMLSPNARHWGSGAGCPISDPGGAADGEDDEEDDPSGQCDEDGINSGLPEFVMQGTSYAGPGCPISDPDVEHNGCEVTGAEDDFMDHGWAGPGCPIADPDCGYDGT